MQRRQGTGVKERIGQASELEPGGLYPLSQERAGDGFAEAANHRMVLGDDNETRLGLTASTIVASSSGLIVGQCSTATSRLSDCSVCATSSARIVMNPLEITSTSAPSRSILALPSSKL